MLLVLSGTLIFIEYVARYRARHSGADLPADGGHLPCYFPDELDNSYEKASENP